MWGTYLSGLLISDDDPLTQLGGGGTRLEETDATHADRDGDGGGTVLIIYLRRVWGVRHP